MRYLNQINGKEEQVSFEEFLDIQPFSWGAIGTTLLIGAIIGLERQLRGKPVGLRTSTLTILGTYFFITSSIAVSNGVTDPSRIIGQVITGVGFLGAGVMMSHKGIVIGVTSAATIWILAALGVCISLGWYASSIKLALIVLFVLLGLDIVENYSKTFTQGFHRKPHDKNKDEPQNS